MSLQWQIFPFYLSLMGGWEFDNVRGQQDTGGQQGKRQKCMVGYNRAVAGPGDLLAVLQSDASIPQTDIL